MKKVVIGFSRPKTWKPFAELIMWWDRQDPSPGKSDASHSYMRFSSVRWESDFIYQNSHTCTNFVSGKRFEDLNYVVEEFSFEVSEEVEAAIGKMCVAREGKGYAIKQVFGIAIMDLTFLFTFGKVKIDNPFRDGDAETTCLEEIGKIMEVAMGKKFPGDLDDMSVKPFREWVRSLAVV